MKIIGLQGIYSNGSRGVTPLLHSLQKRGYQVENMQYEIKISDFYQRRSIEKIVTIAEELYEPGDVIIAHSAGCIIVQRLLLRLKSQNISIDKMWFFNSALDRTVCFPDNVGTIYNILDKDDFILLLARFLPFTCVSVGDMGRNGYVGKNTNVININMKDNDKKWHSHALFNDKKQLEYITNIIDDGI